MDTLTLQQVVSELRAIEADLRNGGDREAAAGRLHLIARRLEDGEESDWIDTTEAKLLLGVEWEKTIEAWARLGRFRSRRLPGGSLQVRREDILRGREIDDALAAFGGEDLSPEELRVLTESRPGTVPWQRRHVGRER